MKNNYVGKRIKRTEDPRLIRGLAHYVDDIMLHGTLHVAFVRSMYAHAKITNIDTSAARSAPGVVAVYTGQDVAEKIGPVPCASALPELKVPDHRVLADRQGLLCRTSDCGGRCHRSLCSARRSRSDHGRLRRLARRD